MIYCSNSTLQDLQQPSTFIRTESTTPPMMGEVNTIHMTISSHHFKSREGPGYEVELLTDQMFVYQYLESWPHVNNKQVVKNTCIQKETDLTILIFSIDKTYSVGFGRDFSPSLILSEFVDIIIRCWSCYTAWFFGTDRF